MPHTTRCYAAHNATDALAPHTIERRDPGPHDVFVAIDYCGVCHSDIHTARSEWGGTQYPVVPGHEIVGHVERVGAKVKKYKVGDTVGVGCMVGSCRTCERCKSGLEQYCDEGMVGTYNGRDRGDGSVTYGGYATHITVHEDFVLRVPAGMDLARTAPLLCAGITTFSPLRHWGAGPGKHVGVVGLGGLGHMGVKLARAMGAHTTVVTHSPHKQKDALALGAHDVLLSGDAEQMKRAGRSFDLLLCTISAEYDLNAYLNLLRPDGHMVVVGLPERPPSLHLGSLIGKRASLGGSLIGGIPETQEMLDYCAENKVLSDVEVIPMDQINTAYARMLKSDVKYRFVIDMKSMRG